MIFECCSGRGATVESNSVCLDNIEALSKVQGNAGIIVDSLRHISRIMLSNNKCTCILISLRYPIQQYLDFDYFHCANNNSMTSRHIYYGKPSSCRRALCKPRCYHRRSHLQLTSNPSPQGRLSLGKCTANSSQLSCYPCPPIYFPH